MPTALVLTIRPHEQATIAGFLGRASHAAFLTALAARNAALAEQLHNLQAVKPFAASDLLDLPPASDRRTVQPDRTYRVRWCALSPEVDEHLQALAAAWPATITLDNVPFAVEDATIDGARDPWARSATWPALLALDQIGREAPPARFTLQFVAPTTFRSSGRNVPLPLPELVFGSLLDRWNAVAPLPLPADIRRFAADCLVLGRYRLESMGVAAFGGREMAFVGRCTYVATNRDRYYLHCCAALLRWAFFSGVGAKASMGFGLVRWQDMDEPRGSARADVSPVSDE